MTTVVCKNCGESYEPIHERIGPMPLCKSCVEVNNTEFDEDVYVTSSGEKYDWSDFDYPFRACKDIEGGWTVEPIGDTNELSYDELFDKNILINSTVFYCRGGWNDGDPWVFMIKRPDDIYVYFNASCDYTGFDCRGGGNIYYTSGNFSTFWNYCLDTHSRTLLKKK